MFLIQKHNFTYVYISKAGYIISWYVNIFLWKKSWHEKRNSIFQ